MQLWKPLSFFNSMLLESLRFRAILAAFVAAAVATRARCQSMSDSDFMVTIKPIPTSFSVGEHYPEESETEVCQPIVDAIDRGSARFASELFTFITQGENDNIKFSDEDSRIMSSRVQTALNRLAAEYGEDFEVLRAWRQYRDPDLPDDSLHYEGRTVRVEVRKNKVTEFLTLAVSRAGFSWVVYEEARSGRNALDVVRLSVIPINCQSNLDMIFMLDQSGSVGRDNHDIAKEFIINVADFFEIGLDKTRIGLVTYSTNSRIKFDLDRYTTKNELEDAINRVEFPGGRTATNLALENARVLLDPNEGHGARPSQDGIPKIAILITDGKSNQGGVTGPANDLKAAGVQVYTVGIGNIELPELLAISSDPDEDFVFLLDSFQDTVGFVTTLSVVTCEAPAIVSTCLPTTASIQDGRIRFFQAECSQFSGSVMVRLQETNGLSFLYCSATQQNPSPRTSDTTSHEDTSTSVRTCSISIDTNKVVYFGVQGQNVSSEFVIEVSSSIFDTTEIDITVAEGSTGQEVYDITQHLSAAATGVTLDYSITGGNTADTFSVTASGGQLVLDGVLNFDTQALLPLTVSATSLTDACHCARLRINVQVLRNRIEFMSLEEVAVSEFVSIGYDVITIQANGGVGSIQYSLEGGNTMNKFRIVSDTGMVEVNAKLDFETEQQYNLIIRAVSVGTNVDGSVTLVVNIVDENEPPVFTLPCAASVDGCSTVVVEEEMAGSIVLSVTADDPDLSSRANGMLQFSILEANSVPFSINSMGTITNTEKLDRETEDFYMFTVIVRDMGSPSLHKTSVVRVTVEDIDDNAPMFQLHPPLSVEENSRDGLFIYQFVVTDADSGSNAMFGFTLSSSDSVPFTLSPGGGILSVSGSIDYESTTSYSLDITAETPGSHSTTITAVVSVIDLNDNIPMFSGAPYRESVEEHSPLQTSIVTILATDADSGSNADITYSIFSGNIQQLLEVNTSSGVISVSGDIDRERLASFSLIVQASDAGDPSRSSTAEVVITVDDINDNAPEFNPSSYSADVREDTPTATPFTILTVFASDADVPGTLNSAIIYSIAPGSDNVTFSLNASSGEFRLEQPLDFEVTQSYQINIIATDRGNPAMSSSAVVDIRVVNINEDPPVLSGDRTVNVSELAPVSSIVARFTALDPDNGTVTFTFSFGNSEGKFFIGGNSGTITLVTTLDFESTRQYMLEITASDGGQSTNATLTVNVIDENEFAPIFMGTLSFQTDEEQSETIPVGTLQATDADGSEPNSLVTYSFGLNEILLSQYFTLDSFSGEIRPLLPLDREMLTHVFPPSQNSSRSAEVIARDGGTPSLQSRDTITIQLLDINDNAPIFTQNSYITSLRENLPANTTVFQLSATDADLGSNAAIEFSFTETGGNEGLFSLDPMTGLMITTQTLDCEFATDYMFSFVAKDLGTPAMSSSVGGRLDIIDENDNSPIFDQSVYDLTVFENFTVGHDVLVVLATDADKGTNGEVSYELIGQVIDDSGENPEEATILVISSTSGIVKHNTPFNFENDPLINLTLLALDMGVPRRTGTAQLSITVVNVDEEAPNFADSCNAPVYAYEDILIGVVVTRCIATDKDNISTEANRDRAIIYSVVDGTGTFSVRETTGEVILAKELDREAQASYEVSVIATDLAGRFTRISLQVIVRDINDNAPTFLEPSYSDTLTDMAILSGQNELLTVVAEDRDEHLAGSVLYAITDVTVSENLLSASIMVIATDQGTPSLNSTVVVTVVFDSPCLIQQYFIGRQTGTLSASLLCSVTISPPSMALPEGSQHMFTCNVLSNAVLSVSFIRDGSRVSPEGTSTTHSIGAARQADTGDYTCSAHSNSLPSLQSTTSRLTVTTLPTITVPPQSIAVAIGTEVRFTCTAIGFPDPEIEWVFQGSVIIQSTELVIEMATETTGGKYTCRAVSVAGTAEDSASLAIIADTNVVEITLTDIDQPSKDGSCHHFDFSQFLEKLSDSDLTTVISSTNSFGVCDSNACSPSPCQNGASCTLDSSTVDGYTCSCTDGYSGKDCDVDIDECQDVPCNSGGTCLNLQPLYSCICAPGFSGSRCQFTASCGTSSCDQGENCIETLTIGLTCVSIVLSSSLRITGPTVPHVGLLNDLIVSYIERLQIRRGRRQASVSLINCEPVFVAVDANTTFAVDANTTFALYWDCPNSTTPPSDSELESICEFLLSTGLVATCQPPNGNVTFPPTLTPIPPANITLRIVQIDEETDSTLDAADVLSNVEEELADFVNTNGITLEDVGPTVPITCSPECINGACMGREICTCTLGWAGPACTTCAPQFTGAACEQCAPGWETAPTCDTCAAGYSGDQCDVTVPPPPADVKSIIIGVVVGVVGLILLILAVVGIVVCAYWKQKDHKKRQKAKKRYAKELSVIANPGAQSSPVMRFTSQSARLAQSSQSARLAPSPQVSRTSAEDDDDAADYDTLEARTPGRPPKSSNQTAAKRASSIYQNLQKYIQRRPGT